MSFNRADIIASVARSRPQLQMIEIALQNHLRGDLIDLTRASSASCVRFSQGAICRHRREAFVPCHDIDSDKRRASFSAKLPEPRSAPGRECHSCVAAIRERSRSTFFSRTISRYAPSMRRLSAGKRFQRMREQTELVGNGHADARLVQDRVRAIASSEQSRSLQFRAEICRRGS